MSVGRRIILFLSLLVLAVCSASMLAGPAVWEYASVLRYGWGRQPYEAAAVGTEGLAAAAGWDGGALRLRLFDLEGRAVGSWAVDLPQEAGGPSRPSTPAGRIWSIWGCTAPTRPPCRSTG